MKRIYIFLLTLCGLALNAGAAPKEQPDASYKLIRESYTVRADGTTDYHCRKEITILRNRALTAYADKGETFIVYNPAFETLTINESYTLREDGSRVETPKNAFVEQLPSDCQNCARYTGLREMVVVHTAMEYGCTIVLDYTIHRKNSHLYAKITPSQDCPVERYELSVKVPQGQKIAVTTKGGLDKYLATPQPDSLHLTITDIAQRYVDAYLPTDNLYPSITICNDGAAANNEAPYLKWIHFDNTEKCEAASVQLVMMMQDDPMDYAKAIHNYVVDNIHFNNVDPSLMNWQVASASQTWQSNCGNAADKAQLLGALLRQAGIEARAVSPDRVDFTVNGAAYHVSPIAKGDPQHNDALPTAKKTSTDTVIAWSGTDIGGHYSQMTLPDVAHTPFYTAYLTTARTAPLHLSRQSILLSCRITLPTGSKLLSKTVHSKAEGTDHSWAISTDISQNGNLLTVKRSLVISNDTDLRGEAYIAFRQALIDWQTAATITIKK